MYVSSLINFKCTIVKLILIKKTKWQFENTSFVSFFIFLFGRKCFTLQFHQKSCQIVSKRKERSFLAG